MSHVVAVKNICEREEISRDVNSHLVEKVPFLNDENKKIAKQLKKQTNPN